MQQQAQLVRQMNYQRMANLEHELKASRQLTLHVAENMPQKIIMPVMPENKAQAPTPTQQYAYRPN
jgi:hypothetical protein